MMNQKIIQKFYLGAHEYVALCDLLKLTGIAESGGRAKYMINQGEIIRNGVVETHKTAKIKDGEIISWHDIDIMIMTGKLDD